MPIDYSKFDHIDDSDDEVAAPVKKPVVAKTEEPPPVQPAGPVKMPEEHTRDLSDAPDLELPEGPWLQYYCEKLTAPQRMQTLVHLWNSADQTERVEFLRHLIDIIDNPAISNRIKGGQEILKDLDGNFYYGVTYPEKWVEDFKEKLSVDDKKIIFEKLFKSLDSSERGLVVGTLM
mmetsp:Transcript_4930/g.11178  ORF Transcript_4930/g.11178 Transcript_4930/m.11178 type:complete len:176 (-) Transcript_4930:79-606(-)|eukprot:CAMPEP_0197879794 /NCGR_PEP_ID=MMETSP1439-20131203/7786_1 /TAXON_ID=66791 /ORGANISM="Gonyaulax spinifera, Strain CCMP409" /LENGTH=175 /DNA_ID=CAMNT_0043499325 /DNA_START=74 /DNA_END=601 /DNA_ORIENTATION=+